MRKKIYTREPLLMVSLCVSAVLVVFIVWFCLGASAAANNFCTCWTLIPDAAAPTTATIHRQALRRGTRAPSKKKSGDPEREKRFWVYIDVVSPQCFATSVRG